MFWAVPVLALMLFAFVRRTQVLFLRANNHVEIRHRSLFRHHIVQLNLSDLTRAIVQQGRDDEGPTYRAALFADSGETRSTYPLTQAFTSGTDVLITVRWINNWLGVLTWD